MEVRYWEITEHDEFGYKEVLLISVNNINKHIYTIENNSPSLASKHPVHYGEKTDRTLSRMKVKSKVSFTKLEPSQAIQLSAEATRDKVMMSAAKRINYYEKQKQKGSDSDEKTNESTGTA